MEICKGEGVCGCLDGLSDWIRKPSLAQQSSGAKQEKAGPGRTGFSRISQLNKDVFVERQRWVNVFRSSLRLKEKNKIRISGEEQIELHHTQQKHTHAHTWAIDAYQLRCVSPSDAAVR